MAAFFGTIARLIERQSDAALAGDEMSFGLWPCRRVSNWGCVVGHRTSLPLPRARRRIFDLGGVSAASPELGLDCYPCTTVTARGGSRIQYSPLDAAETRMILCPPTAG